ncbi:MAG TPA: RNA polymerase sigma factor [Solirubrobacteraceae bacterium]|jgi:RNA polymerase sigma-70 factor (ECF subfamily)|nr:RNA polymerase sigma factor [Solirubrobacteraceae bacterium]
MHRRLNVKDGHVGFRRRTTLDDSPETARETRLAIARTKEGDRDALRFLYTRYSDNVYGYICSIVRDEQEAEDLTQHVFMKLITVIVQYQDHGIPFTGWLLRLSRNVALDHLRRRRPMPTEEVFGANEHIDEDSRDRARDLHSALASLPEEQRDVMVMRHVVGLSPPEIAEQMGRTESSVHGLHHRGRRALQEELRRLGSSPSVAYGQLSAAC